MAEEFNGWEARLRAVERVTLTLERLLPKLETLIEGRSGEAEKDETMARSLNSAHQKLREIEARQNRQDARLSRYQWMTMGAIAMLNTLFVVASWLIDHAQLFGWAKP
jgi:hypothetical protein